MIGTEIHLNAVADGPPADADRVAAGPPHRLDEGGHSPRGPHARRSPLADLADGVTAQEAILWLGAIDSATREALQARGGRLLIAPEVAELDRVDFGRARHDLVFAHDVLGRVRQPERLLEALGRSIRGGGRLAVSAPNAAHKAVRDALGRDADPYESGGPLDRDQARLFTRESLASAVEAAGFVVGRIDGEADRDDEVTSWVVLAYPLPVPGLDLLRDRCRDDAFARFDAERANRQLRDLLDRTRQALDAADRRAEAMADRHRSARSDWADAQADLLARDEAFSALSHELLARLEEVEPLRQARDSAHRHALAAEHRCRSLELRAEHVLMEFPRRIARKLRAALRRAR